MEEISMDAGTAVARPKPRWMPNVARWWIDADSAGTFTTAGTPPIPTSGVPMYIPWNYAAIGVRSQWDINEFITPVNDITPGVHGIKLNHPGLYWVSARLSTQLVFSGQFSHMSALIIGPSLEDSSMLSAGSASDTLNTGSGSVEANYMVVEGVAYVQDPNADNHIYATFMCRTRGGSIGVIGGFMYLSYLGVPDRRATNG